MTEAVKNTPAPISEPVYAPNAQDLRDPLWARLLLPSVTDLIFLAFFWMLTFGPWAQHLLADADTGWHIRNGEHILRTLSVPRADYFSYTMPGRPWFAWEWLYDVLLGATHNIAGLNGVVVLTAFLIAITFALLFRHALQSGGNILVASALTLISGAAATIHFLARPHVVSWLLTLVWFRALQRYQSGEQKHLYWLPALMLLWVNLHGGFLMGLMLISLFLVANAWTSFTASSPARRERAGKRVCHLAVIGATTLAATLFTPYGYRLYLHLFRYLGSTYLMNHISEFLTPDFHSTPVKFFAALLGLSAIALAAFTGAQLKVIDLLTILFSVWAGLFAARNIPIAAILLTLTIAPLLSDAVRRAADRSDIALRQRALAASFDSFGTRMGAMEHRFRAHLLPLALTITAVAISLNQGRALGQTVLKLTFDQKNLPVAATEYLVAHNIRDHFFSPDNWGGYLIYRMYPHVSLFIDDRHDFYGEPFVREYMKVAQVQQGWSEVLDRYQVRHVLTSPQTSLANVLRVMPGWHVAYSDQAALVFSRQN